MKSESAEAYLIDEVVRVLPELLSWMRRMSTPAFKVWRPRIIVRLSMKENVLPTSVSSEVPLTPSNGPGLTSRGDVPKLKLWKLARLNPNFHSLIVLGEKLCCN